MVEIIPNWHPVFVHFTIGLLLTGSVLFLAGYLFKSSNAGSRITTAARWNLGIGAVFAIVTVATGYQAYYSVAHDAPSHAAMTIHLKWAWAALVLYIIAVVLARRDRHRVAGASLPLSVVLVAGVIALAVTGFLGAENVYRHGLGVMRLPEAAGPGHSHAHGDGEEHDHGDTVADQGERSDTQDHGDDGHEHDNASTASADDSNSHEHAGTASAPVAQGHSHAAPETPQGVLDAFHHALEEGNGQAALQWLAEDVVILEGGVAQTREEYASHHLGSDMAFLAAMQAEQLSREIQQNGAVVTIITRTQLKGAFKDRDIDITSSETAILKRTEGGWRIQHLHWSN